MTEQTRRTVVVTGGATGIGRATAARFTRAGDHVVVVGRRADLLEATARELGAVPLRCDVTDPDQVTAALDRLPGAVDVLVNNAGGNTDLHRSGEAPEKDGLAALARSWRANLETNLVSAVLVTTALEPRLTGAVVHLGSIAADRGSGAYGAAKAGLASWNVDLARTLGPRDVTSNVVAPGYIAETEFFADRLSEERRTRLVADTVTGRAGEPDDVAAVIEFLASPAARHVTGQVVNVNGGAWNTR